jgi:cytochrome c5
MRRLTWLAATCLLTSLQSLHADEAPAPAPTSPPAVQQPAPEVKEGAGKDVFLAKCSSCHALTDVISKRKTRDAWALRIREMIQYGAEVNAADAKTITDYLTDHYGL